LLVQNPNGIIISIKKENHYQIIEWYTRNKYQVVEARKNKKWVRKRRR
jgi:hypothetical protein